MDKLMTTRMRASRTRRRWSALLLLVVLGAGLVLSLLDSRAAGRAPWHRHLVFAPDPGLAARFLALHTHDFVAPALATQAAQRLAPLAPARLRHAGYQPLVISILGFEGAELPLGSAALFTALLLALFLLPAGRLALDQPPPLEDVQPEGPDPPPRCQGPAPVMLLVVSGAG